MASLATWPVVTRFGVEIPGELTDPLEHLWIMRWLRSCLLEGRNPLFCPEIQAPVGVPLGYFPTLHLQTVLYLLMRLITANDAAIFTAIWFVGFVATGLASFALARWALPGLGAGVAWVAGLGVMLCGPMLMHAHGHLETMQMGVVPPFLIAWIRFIDLPSRGRLAAAVACYWLVVAAAPYFAVLAIFPAAWYVVVALGVGSDWWPRTRYLGPWMIGFGLIVLPGVAVLFAGQIWAAAQGFPMTRSKRLFDHYGAPVWSSLAPSSRHPVGRILDLQLFERNGYAGRMTECSSYLGLVVLGLIGYAAITRVRFPRRGFWWSVLGLMIVLSWGSRQQVFGVSIFLPAGWIYGIFPPFHLIRVPARFNLFAAAVAVVPVAAALRALVERQRWSVRGGFLGALTALTLADLAMVPFPTAAIPEPPAYYAAIRRTNPTATVLEVPLFDSTEGQTFSSLWGYWQQLTGLKTSGGYPGLTNTRFDADVAQPSVFAARRLKTDDEPGFRFDFGLCKGSNPRDQAWMELTARGYDYAILHHGPWLADHASDVLQLAHRLQQAEILEDAEATIIDRSQLAPPESLAWTTAGGFRRLPDRANLRNDRYAVLREANLTLYQPADPLPRAIRFQMFEVAAFVRPRVIRLCDGERELCRWSVGSGEPVVLESPPIAVAAGLHRWTLLSDGDDRPTRRDERFDDAATPYSFQVTSFSLQPVKQP